MKIDFPPFNSVFLRVIAVIFLGYGASCLVVEFINQFPNMERAEIAAWVQAIGTILAFNGAILVFVMQSLNVADREKRDSTALAVAIQAEIETVASWVVIFCDDLREAKSRGETLDLIDRICALKMPVLERHLDKLGCFHAAVARKIATAFTTFEFLKTFPPEKTQSDVGARVMEAIVSEQCVDFLNRAVDVVDSLKDITRVSPDENLVTIVNQHRASEAGKAD